MPRFFLLVAILQLIVAFGLTSRTQSPRSLLTRRFVTMSPADVTINEVRNPKVPSTAWKWPPVWPFPPDALDAITTTPEGESSSTLIKAYNGKQISKFKEHLDLYVPNGSKVLELSSDVSNNFLSIDETDIDHIYFNDKSIGGVDPMAPLKQFHEPKFPYPSNSFNTVIVTDGLESLTNPRDVFREIWRVLKPGGRCLCCFSSMPAKLPAMTSPVKMWTTMTDEQKIWIVGSYYQYSAGPGWKDIEGYDLLEIEKATEANSEGVTELVFDETREKTDTGYVVQATKLLRSTQRDFNALEEISYTLLPAKYMDSDDREFSALRLSKDYERCETDQARQAVMVSVEMLPKIYSILRKVQDSVIPKPAKAMLANLLVGTWKDTDVQISTLKKSLGLETIDEYWTEVGQSSGKLHPKDKIILLGELVSRMENPKYIQVPNAMTVIRSYLVDQFVTSLSEEEETNVLKMIETFTAQVVVSDLLLDTASDNSLDRILRYMASLSKSDLKAFINVKSAAATSESAEEA